MRRIKHDLSVDISEDDCDFLDAVYLPSKYPLLTVLPDFEPDNEICSKGLQIAETLIESVVNLLSDR